MKKNRIIYTVSLFFGLILTLLSCNENKQKADAGLRGTPIIVVDTLYFDEESKTFSLTIHADSTAEAEVSYYLYDGDSLLQECLDGQFRNIAPLVEGYDVKAKVVWSDTTVYTPLYHVNGFVVPQKPVEKISCKELQSLINAQDHSVMLGEHECLVQGVQIKTADGKEVSMQDVLLYLSNKVWTSVEVTDINYNENNQVTNFTIKPKEVKTKLVTDDEDWFDEY